PPEHGVRSRLKGSVKVRSHPPGRFTQERPQPVVDFRGLDAGDPEPHVRHLPDETLQQLAEGGAKLAPIAADVDSRQADLRMMPGELAGLGHELVRCAGARDAARRGGGAERTVLVAAVLYPQQRT